MLLEVVHRVTTWLQMIKTQEVIENLCDYARKCSSASHRIVQFCLFCFLWRCGPMQAMASSFLRFLDHTQRRITVGRTPLDE